MRNAESKAGYSVRCECGGGTGVIDTRRYPSRNAMRRRRKCIKCKGRFSTIEMTLDDFNALLAYKGRLEALTVALRPLME